MGEVPTNMRNLGKFEPLAFLHVWRDIPPGPKGHRHTNPRVADVKVFHDAHLAELDALSQSFAAP